jgi:hypothetical protein
MSTISKTLGENINTAVSVLLETYKNLDLLFTKMDRIGKEEGFVSLTPRFMRWKSDADHNGWLTSNFIKLYQKETDPLATHLLELREGPLFGIEVDLDRDEGYPIISLVEYTYDYSMWTRMPSLADHWVFWIPFRNENDFEIKEENGLWSSELNNKKNLAKRYWGIQKAISRDIPLMEVSSAEDIKNKVFDRLKALK